MNIINKYKSTILLFVLSSLWALHFSLVKLVEADNNPFSILVPLLLILCFLFYLVLKINNQIFKSFLYSTHFQSGISRLDNSLPIKSKHESQLAL